MKPFLTTLIIGLYALASSKALGQGRDTTSVIQTIEISSGKIDTILVVRQHLEAPNWHRDGFLILNGGGALYKLPLVNGKLSLINTGSVRRINNDHGISPDGKSLVISNNDIDDPSPKPYKSALYILPVEGGKPRKVTQEVPSFWHGWSPDGSRLAYCAERGGNFDIYTIGVKGGLERRLTNAEGLDDGPDYSADGKYIYFNSYRTGHMQIWRMLADGSKPEQLTFDGYSNWFAHPSPDNKLAVYLSYMSDEKQKHVFGKDVKLRVMDIESKSLRDLTKVFYGGQGTINVPSWSPDSKRIAFVSYIVK